MKLTKAEQKLLVKILENTVERFEPDDLIHMINGPKYHRIITQIYDECFRSHIKRDQSVLNEKKVMSQLESKIVHAIWKKVSDYLKDELEN
jgi:hypothetical protein